MDTGSSRYLKNKHEGTKTQRITLLKYNACNKYNR